MFKVYEFHWKAINRFQQKQKGKLLARNQDELEQRLIKKGFQQIKISRNFILPKNPKSEEVTQLISQLALLINAKLPLKQALSIILENTQNIKIYLWLEEIIRSVELGYSFSKSLENLKSESGKFLDERNINVEVKNFYIATVFDFFTKYQNENVKHNINFKDIEIDFIFNQTTVLMQFLIVLHKQNS